MIRINTAPLGMQNLLSGNRKLYYLTATCADIFKNVSNKLIRDNDPEGDVSPLGMPIEPPFVLASYDGSTVTYSNNDTTISINNGLKDNVAIDLINYCPQNQITLKSVNVPLGDVEEFKVNVPYDTISINSFKLKLYSEDTVTMASLKDQYDETINLGEYDIDVEDYYSQNGKEFYFTNLIYNFNSKNTGRKIKRININYTDR